MTLDRNTLLEAAKMAEEMVPTPQPQYVPGSVLVWKRYRTAQELAAHFRALAAAQPDTVCVPKKPTRVDLEAMEAFACRIGEMKPNELKAALRWLVEYSWAHLKHRERWPWWDQSGSNSSTSAPAAPDAAPQSKDGGAINAGSGNGADRKPGLPHPAAAALAVSEEVLRHAQHLASLTGRTGVVARELLRLHAAMRGAK